MNITGTYCPNCALFKGEYPTARVSSLYDTQYHQYKFYIHCRTCKATTPAYENARDAIENWDDLFIKKETEVALEGVKENRNGNKNSFFKKRASSHS